jgi:ATP-dependent protease ClpP protease subunit
MSDIKFELPKEPTRVWDLYVPIVVDGVVTSVFLTNDVIEPSAYDEIIFLLDNATDEQHFKFYINTPGGDLDSTVGLIGAIDNTRASTSGKLSGSVASAGTMITMACDTIEVDNHTKFMVHTYSTGIQGKGNEVKAQQEFMNTAINDLMHDVYKGFLTTDEVEKLIEGTDYWFNKDELLRRWAIKQGA